ncbi:MAG TPA: Uma2 family endonuclease [Bryobacteraceae bacterium]|nr:Uma2 family endonuclease [Bryobacteraceae bacterium]
MPTKLHALIQFLLVTLLRKQGVEALAEVSVKVSDTRFLIPDVIADVRIEDPYPVKPVALCVDVLSPKDLLSSAFAKCEDYHNWGVPCCWVIDPVRQTAWEYHAQGDPARIERDGALHAGELIATFGEIFS